jgi:transcriptional regulator with XRE-family HTH domain
MSQAEERKDRSTLGQFIRAQRKLAELSQRELARLADLSDPYVSQLERDHHDPSIRVLRSIANALNIRAETILSYAGWLQNDDDTEADRIDAEAAILADYRLTAEQQQALISTYRAFLVANGSNLSE